MDSNSSVTPNKLKNQKISESCSRELLPANKQVSSTYLGIYQTGAVIVFLMTTALFSFDIYYPSLPAMTLDFGTTPGFMQLSVSLYFFPLAFVQLLFGPLSNQYGRRRLLLLGTLFSIAGSIICSFSYSISYFLFGRFVQGIGVGSYYVITRAIMRDLCVGSKLAQLNSLISASISLSPCLAPVLGGYLQTSFGWRANFYCLTGLFCSAFATIYYLLPETLRTLSLKKPLNEHVNQFVRFLTDLQFLKYLGSSALAYSGLIVFLTLAPFIFEWKFCYSPLAFSFLSFFVMSGLTLGSLLNSFLVTKYPLSTLIYAAGIVIVLSGLFLIIGESFFSSHILWILLSAILYAITCNIVFANTASEALTPLDADSIGAATAVFGSIQILIPAILSAIVTLLPFDYQLIVGWTFLSIGLFIISCFIKRLKNRNFD